MLHVMSRTSVPLLALLLAACPAPQPEAGGEATGASEPKPDPEPEATAEPQPDPEPEPEPKPEPAAKVDPTLLKDAKRAEDADQFCSDGKIAYEHHSLSPPDASGCDAIRTNDTMVEPNGETRDVENVYWCCPPPA